MEKIKDTGCQTRCNGHSEMSEKPSESEVFLERCPSGLRSTLGKRVYSKGYRGFESLSLRRFLTSANPAHRAGFFILGLPLV